MSAISLPPGFTTRPLAPSDSAAVYDLMAAQELHDIGTVEIEEEDLIAEWQRPSYDLEGSSVAVLDGERIVAYGELMGARPVRRRGPSRLPEDAGSGPGSPSGCASSHGRAALRWSGCRCRKARRATDSWRSSATASAGRAGCSAFRPVAPSRSGRLPDGYALRVATEADREQVWHVVEDAFLEWSDREKESFEDFAAQFWLRPGFEPWQLQVVTAPDGGIAGAVFSTMSEADGNRETYVSAIAVHKEHRNRGLAQALLVAAFSSGREHGASSSCLSTDSRTGALSLYEKVGMVTDSVWVNRAIDLG